MHNVLIDVDVLAKLRADLAAARDGLERYGQHEAQCAIYQRTHEQIERLEWPPCTCGLDRVCQS